MKLSKKGEYALRSMIGLGVAAEVGRSLVSFLNWLTTSSFHRSF